MSTSYEQRARAAREQLRDALAPVGQQENAAVEHLFRCVSDLPTLETIALMVDRAITEVAADTQAHAYRAGLNTNLSPERPPGADHLYTLLGGDLESNVIISRVVVQLDMDTLAAFSGLVVNMFSAAVRDGAKTGRMECLQAVQAVIDEVAEGQARREARERP